MQGRQIMSVPLSSTNVTIRAQLELLPFPWFLSLEGSTDRTKSNKSSTKHVLFPARVVRSVGGAVRLHLIPLF